MRSLVLAVAAFLAMLAPVYAQVPSGNVFLGYSYLNLDTNSANRSAFNGWEGSIEGKVFPFLGVVADFSAHYGKGPNEAVCPVVVIGGNCRPVVTSRAFNALFGPRVSVSIKGIRPFAHVLVGISQTDPGGDTT